ncbi:hypothetical protein ACHAPT_004913 [Fusarium lateritium]
MRLLNTQSIVIETFDDDQIPPYAILSHTWEAQEVTFHDVELGKATGKKGWAKLKGSCYMASKNGFDYVWLDTCCIDKTSSAELSEAINSMYRWYQEAAVCYVYLADVSELSGLPGSRWFTRGWTLQELIAPSSIIFFSRMWEELGTKATLNEVISERTGIPKAILSGNQDLETASVAQRMSWAAERRTTRREDVAYCLMGIFNINMPLLYGEGEKAFIRLQEEIMRVSDDHSLFAWRHPHGRGGLLAPSPAAFKDSGNITPWNPLMPYNSPFTLTNKGVHLDLPFIGLGDRGTGLAVLSCTEAGDQDKLVAIYLQDLFLTMEHFKRCKSEQFDLIDLKKCRPAQYPTRSLCIGLRGLNQRPNEVLDNKAKNYRPRVSDEQSNGGESDEDTEMEQDEQFQLFLAAAQGREADVRRLLALPDVQADFNDDEERTPLSFAAEAGHEGVVRLLLDQRDVNINSIDINGNQPISYAIEEGNEGVVWQLLARGDIYLDSEDAMNADLMGWKLLSMAAIYDREALLGQLLARRDTREQVTYENCMYALCCAAEGGKASAVRLLLGSGKVHLDQKCGYGCTALWSAASNGEQAVVKMLLETGWVDAGCEDSDGGTPLWHAASKGYEETARLLLQHGADIESPGEDDRSPLCAASSNGHASIVKELLAHGAETGARSHDSLTALMEAAINGHEVIARALLQSGADLDMKVCTGAGHPTALDYACKAGHENIVKLLLDHGATINGFEHAAQGGHAGIIKLLLENGPPSARRDVDISRVLHDAVEIEHADIVSVLLEATEDKQAVLRPFDLVVATINSDQAMVKVLLENGADANSKWNGSLLLGFATKQGCDEMVQVLLSDLGGEDWRTRLADRIEASELGYEVGRTKAARWKQPLNLASASWFSLTPLWCAAVNGDEAMVQLLLENGASPDAEVQDDRTALCDAVLLNRRHIVRLLLASGADTEKRTTEGNTPLMHAARLGKVALVKLLLRHRANRKAKNVNSETALSLASNQAVADLLR